MKTYFEYDSNFKKSSACGDFTCVAVAISPEQKVAIRNSGDEHKTTLFFTEDEWSAFIKGVKNGEFDLS